MTEFIEAFDEETPLLKKSDEVKKTPLPKLQIGIVLLLQVAEPVCSQSIYPYINEVRALPFLSIHMINSASNIAHQHTGYRWRRRDKSWLLCRPHRASLCQSIHSC